MTSTHHRHGTHGGIHNGTGSATYDGGYSKVSVWALADVSFKHRAGPRVIGCLYLLAIATISMGTLLALLIIWSLASWAGEGWWYFAPVITAGAIGAVLAVRVILEVAMALLGGPVVKLKRPDAGAYPWGAGDTPARPGTAGPGPLGPTPSFPPIDAGRRQG